MSQFIKHQKGEGISFAQFDTTILGREVYDTIVEVGKLQVKEMRKSVIIPEDTGMYKKSLDIKQDYAFRRIFIFENRKRKGNRRLIGHLLEHGVPENNMEAQPHWIVFENKYIPVYEEAVQKAIEELT